MKKMNLTSYTLLLCLAFVSCKKEETSAPPAPAPLPVGAIASDYIIDLGNYSTGSNSRIFTTDISNNVHTVTQREISSNSNIFYLNNITPDGSNTLTTMHISFNSVATNHLRASSSKNGVIHFTARLFPMHKNFYTLTTVNGFSEPKITNSLPNNPSIVSICNYGDDSYLMYDETTKSLIRFMPGNDSSIFIAGNGQKQMKDGFGASAGFTFVTKIVAQNNLAYLIDSSHNIRKVETTNGIIKVTTVISNFQYELNDLAIDAQGNLFVLALNAGLYKLDVQSNSLVNVSKDYKVKAIGGGWINLQYTSRILINGNNMYLIMSDNRLHKISDFKTKFKL